MSQTYEVGNLFVVIGAAPNTAWIRGCLELDDKGFIRTAPTPSIPGPFATSRPGVFAVGDVRANSVKRVAPAVGEGAAVVQAIHAFFSAPDEP